MHFGFFWVIEVPYPNHRIIHNFSSDQGNIQTFLSSKSFPALNNFMQVEHYQIRLKIKTYNRPKNIFFEVPKIKSTLVLLAFEWTVFE